MAEALELKNPAPQGGTPRRGSRLPAPSASTGGIGFLALAGMIAMSGDAQAQAQGLIVRPSIDATLTYTDNARASRDGEEDLIAEVSPAIGVARNQGRVTGSLQARLRNVMYAEDSGRNSTFVALHGRGQAEVVEKTLFLDMSATISRNNTSELSGRSSDDSLSTERENETRMFSLGPRVHFRLGTGPRGVASYTMSWLEGGGATVGRTAGTARANLADPDAFGRAGWALDYRRTDTNYDEATGLSSSRADTYEQAVRASLMATVLPTLRLHAVVGHESNDYQSRSGNTGTITGFGLDWRPTPRTSFKAETEKRVFGRGYDLSFAHRHSLSRWTLSYSRDISAFGASRSDVFDDPAFQSLYDSLETQIPDPFERENFARRQLGYPTIGSRDPFVTNSYSVAKTLRGSVSLIGARNILTLSLQRTERERLGDPLVNDPRDDLSTFATVKSRSASVSLNHSLSPHASLDSSFVRSYASGSGGDSAETRRSALTVGFSTRLGARSHGRLSYRHQQASGRTDFTENIVTAGFGMVF